MQTLCGWCAAAEQESRGERPASSVRWRMACSPSRPDGANG